MSHRVPAYCHFKPRDLAYVKLNGKRFYLGPYGSDESREEYDRLIAAWLVSGRTPDDVDDDGEPLETRLTVNDLFDAFWEYAVDYYGDHRQSTVWNYRQALDEVRQDFGETLAESFTSTRLLAVQQRMIARGLSRTTINMQTSRLKRVFRWAASRELIPVATYQLLSTVEGIAKGRTQAKEARRVPPVPDEHIEATTVKLPDVVADMVKIQRLTGMRPGELCRMCPRDIDRSNDVWLYTPAKHKTEHHGHARVIVVGPKAQAILAKYLLRDAAAPCFSPSESERQRLAEMHERRTTPMSCGNKPSGELNANLGLIYTPSGYRRAVERAARRAGVPVWTPHQLRHTAATAIRAERSLESAQVVLGHATSKVTEIYAEKNLALAVEAARRLG